MIVLLGIIFFVATTRVLVSPFNHQFGLFVVSHLILLVGVVVVVIDVIRVCKLGVAGVMVSVRAIADVVATTVVVLVDKLHR